MKVSCEKMKGTLYIDLVEDPVTLHAASETCAITQDQEIKSMRQKLGF